MLSRIARAIASRPALYEFIQIVSGQRYTVKQLASALADADVSRALDVGSAGGGTTRGLLSNGVATDIDPLPLLALKRSSPRAKAVGASIAALPFLDAAFPTAICVAVSHHLDEPTLRAGLAEIARVTSDRFVFVDALRMKGRLLSSLLWRYDRGRFPRTREHLLAAIEEQFAIETVVEYRFLHCYLLCVAKPHD